MYDEDVNDAIECRVISGNLVDGSKVPFKWADGTSADVYATDCTLAVNDASIFEQEHPSRSGWTSEMMMVKALKRSSQATELNKPNLTRTPKTLWDTWAYLKQHILDIDLDGPDQRFIESELIAGAQDRASGPPREARRR